MIYTFLHRPESNRVDPRTLPTKGFDFDLPDDWDIAELLSVAYERGLPRGSARCGCVEVQSDHGIWTSHNGGRIVASKAVFQTWEQLEAQETNNG